MKKPAQNLIEDLVTAARNKGLAHLHTEDEAYNGRHITINGRKLINFGLCSYFGLEIDPRLKKGAINAIERYGIHFSCSRAYVSTSPFKELESLVRQIFNAPVAITTSLSLGHHSVMPVVVGENDAIILDQQVHSSVRDAALKMQGLGVKVTVIHHNDLNELKLKIEELTPHYDKIWYLIDGVYSMYGDYAPIHALNKLLNTNKKFHLYADDAHGMGWAGKNGKGYILSQIDLHPKLILATSLNKAYGAGGGVFVFHNEELCEKVKSCGTSFIFSAPHSLPVLGAAIESAKIFLSDELEKMQKNLSEKVAYCQKLLEHYNLPVISNPQTPIFFIGLGLVRVGYNIVNRLIEDGCYVNLSSYPAVPETCTGMRFTITLHHTFEDIKHLVKSLANHFPRALEEEGRTVADINRAFKRVIVQQNETRATEPARVIRLQRYKVQHETTIRNISKELWDSLFSNKGNFDWSGLELLEKSFTNNEKDEDNWKFHYYIIRDQDETPLLATYFTVCLSKDDMLAPASISEMIEKIRKNNPHYFTSRTFMMGSLISEGDHLYVNRSHPEWKKVLMLLLDKVWKQHDRQKTNTLLLRDFNAQDQELSTFFREQGFFKVNLPDTHIFQNKSQSKESYVQDLKHENRYYLKQRILKFENLYNLEISTNPDKAMLEHYYNLYLNVADKSRDVNAFRLPYKFFQELAMNENFEFISLSLKPESDAAGEQKPIGVAINYRSTENYYFLLTGINYSYLKEHNVYSQILWQVITRANFLNLRQTSLGFTAGQNKRKFGARAIPKIAFMQVKDDCNMQIIDTMPAAKRNAG